MTKRVVIVDPAHSHPYGHHAELNGQLLEKLRQAGLAVECWVDRALQTSDEAFRPVLEGCGYVDPRHWIDLPGSLHLASRLRGQLQHAAAGAPVDLWIAHSLLPFQIIGLAQLLQCQLAARVEISILYAPCERLGGSTEPSALSPGHLQERDLAMANTRLAWSGLARAVAVAGHRLRIGCASRLLGSLHAPLLAAAGLQPSELQPAVVGAGVSFNPLPTTDARPQVLLHWGDIKPGKGRGEVMALVAALLEGCAIECEMRWLFHHASAQLLPSEEISLLNQADQQLQGFRVYQGPVESAEMQTVLADTSVAFLPYSPMTYAERSSGVLWCYGAARLASQRPAVAVGYAGGWLAEEAEALGIVWVSRNQQQPSPETWLGALNEALYRTHQPASFTQFGRLVLGQSYADWLLSELDSSSFRAGNS